MRKFILLILIAILATASGLFLLYRNFHRALPTKPFVEDLIGNREVRVKPYQEITINLVGDIMLSRNVAAQIEKAKDPALPFRQLSNFLTASDFNFGNLESPFSPPPPPKAGTPPCKGGDELNPLPAKEGGAACGGVVGGHSLIFGAPSANVQGLIKYNFKVVSLANNHALDQGLKGLVYTKKLLGENGIAAVGAGENLDEAWQATELEVKGTKFCFLAASYASINDGGKSRNDYVARIEDLNKLKSVIKNLTQVTDWPRGSNDGVKSNCDFIAVSMHAGAEYTHTPNQSQIAFAHAAIDAGADVVVGHHPHWVQTVERYTPTQPAPIKGEESSNSPPLVGGVREGGHTGLIFYSLGNFIFDQEWSQKTKEGLTVRLTLEDAKLKSAELVPIIVENYCCARLANEKESKQILENIHATSTLIKL